MDGPIFALAREKAHPSIGSHVTDVIDPAIGATERVVRETVFRLIEVVA